MEMGFPHGRGHEVEGEFAAAAWKVDNGNAPDFTSKYGISFVLFFDTHGLLLRNMYHRHGFIAII